MPNVRAHHRSSDSVDFERIAVFGDIEEMTHALKNQSSPVEAPPTNLSVDPTPLSHDTSRQDYATPRESRSNSRASETSHTNAVEKWEVFRDNGSAHRPATVKDDKQLRETRTKKYPGTPNVPDNDEDDDEQPPPNTAIATISHLTLTLRALATTRTSLLRQLDDLQSQENAVLTLLTQASLPVPISEPAPLNAPSLQTPRIQSSKMPKKTLHTRTVSAPETATPKSARQSSRGRVVLGDKTPVIDDETLTPHFPATRVYAAKAVSKRVPIHFGDDDGEYGGMARTAGGRGRSRSHSRGRGMGHHRSISSCGRNKSRSTSRAPDTPDGKITAYVVPDTVGRKRWDF